ncbi:uncharacterized protein LOC131005083 [Salvia miltiorrhiza]|uniref:uncharacterized protein LOC131005083 n=1 Tax=Salvia miltiorrhiza TaxID=226208 RepID=UPI0025ACEE73|nr:uncharacterized protein LOC131005083 [Salvia miltiorrhiza]
MAAITKRLLHLRPTFHSYTRPYPYPLRHFSSSSDRDDDDSQSEQSRTRSSVSSSLNDVRASLQNRPPLDRLQPPRGGLPQNPALARDMLAEFRSRSAPPPPSSGKYSSFHELFEKNHKPKGENSDAGSSIDFGGANHSFDSFRERSSKLNLPGAADSGRRPVDFGSVSNLTKDLKMKVDPNGKLAAGSGGSISRFWQKDFKGKGGGVGNRTEYGKYHEQLELGKRLQAMRPEKRKGKWFSLQEMGDRLAKLKEAKKQETGKFPSGVQNALADSLSKLTEDSKENEKKVPQATMGVLSSMGAALEEKVAGPPKDHLIEKYFHPDNMSSAEKLKLELQKVRDEFKMSESDCGSARVQVAQLTTKIKHLSSVLHKKDKHSTRGLLAMVQRRKKLLKYLRRTDWDSYCLVLSKLGLRDNPDVKA